ncbi:hypothetical protein V8F33_000357 [Rhypophila sp. PSN 637]
MSPLPRMMEIFSGPSSINLSAAEAVSRLQDPRALIHEYPAALHVARTTYAAGQGPEVKSQLQRHSFHAPCFAILLPGAAGRGGRYPGIELYVTQTTTQFQIVQLLGVRLRFGFLGYWAPPLASQEEFIRIPRSFHVWALAGLVAQVAQHIPIHVSVKSNYSPLLTPGRPETDRYSGSLAQWGRGQPHLGIGIKIILDHISWPRIPRVLNRNVG